MLNHSCSPKNTPPRLDLLLICQPQALNPATFPHQARTEDSQVIDLPVYYQSSPPSVHPGFSHHTNRLNLSSGAVVPFEARGRLEVYDGQPWQRVCDGRSWQNVLMIVRSSWIDSPPGWKKGGKRVTLFLKTTILIVPQELLNTSTSSSQAEATFYHTS